MFDREGFEQHKASAAQRQGADKTLKAAGLRLVNDSFKHSFGHQWTWLGMPILQMTEDIVTMQEVIWRTKPDLIIETGVAWGGSIVYSASVLQLLGHGEVIGIDVTIPEHNVREIMKYPFSDRITLIEGSSVDADVFAKVKARVKDGAKIMVVLDSNHTHEHVLAELRLYAPLVTQGQYLVTMDTIVEYLDDAMSANRPWGKGDNPYSALQTYLKETDRFELDPYIDAKMLVTFSPHGYLKCVR